MCTHVLAHVFSCALKQVLSAGNLSRRNAQALILHPCCLAMLLCASHFWTSLIGFAPDMRQKVSCVFH